MSISVVQSSGLKSSSGKTIVYTFPSSVVVGNMMIVAASANINTAYTVTVSDNLGNTWTQAASKSQTTSGYIETSYVFCAPVTTGGSCTVTITATQTISAGFFAGFIEASGVGVLDQTGTSNTLTVTSPTTTSSSELAVIGACFDVSSGTSVSVTAPSGFTLIGQNGSVSSTNAFWSGYKVLSSITTPSYTFTDNNGNISLKLLSLATFKSAVTSSSGTFSVTGTSSAKGESPTVFQNDYVIDGIRPASILDFSGNNYWDGTTNTVVDVSTLVTGSPVINSSGMDVTAGTIQANGSLLSSLEAPAVTVMIETYGATLDTTNGIGILGFTSGNPDGAALTDGAGHPGFWNGTWTGTSANTDWTKRTSVSTSWSSGGRELDFNGGGDSYYVTASGDYSTVTGAYVGGYAGTKPLNGYVRKLAVYPQKLNFNQMRSLSDQGPLKLPLSTYIRGVLLSTSSDYVSPGTVMSYEHTQPWTMLAEINASKAGTGSVIHTNVTSKPWTGWETWVEGTGGKVKVRLMSGWTEDGGAGGSGATNMIDVQGSIDVLDSKFHLIGVTYDGSGLASGIKIYVDGVQDTSTTVMTDALSGSIVSANPLWIGNQLGGGFPISGELRSFIVHTVVRDSTWMSALYQSERFPIVDSNTAIHYEFDDAVGTLVTDKSNNSYNGTLYGSTQWVARAGTRGGGPTTIGGAGTSSSTSSAAGHGASLAASVGSSVGYSLSTGVQRVVASGRVTSSGTSSGAGTGVAIASSRGASGGTSSSSFTLASYDSVSGTSTGASTAAGETSSVFSFTGTSHGLATTTGVSGSVVSGKASSSGTSLAESTGSSYASSSFTSHGTSSGTGTGSEIAGSVFGSTGYSSAQATLVIVYSSTGSSSGESTASSVGGSIFKGNGSSRGSSSASGESVSSSDWTFRSTGSSSSSFVGGSYFETKASSPGTSDAFSTGNSISSGDGTSSGHSSVTGTSSLLDSGVFISHGTSSTQSIGKSDARSVASTTGKSTAFGTSDMGSSVFFSGGDSLASGESALDLYLVGVSRGSSNSTAASLMLAAVVGVSVGSSSSRASSSVSEVPEMSIISLGGRAARRIPGPSFSSSPLTAK